MLKKLWNDPVWSKVIAAAIIGLAGIAFVSYRHWWSVIWHWITDLHAYLVSTTPIRHWVLGLLVLLAVLFVLLIIGLSATAFGAKSEPYSKLVSLAPDWAFYTWWKYEGPDIDSRCVPRSRLHESQ